MKNIDVYIPTEVAARLEGLSLRGMRDRIQRGFYPEHGIKRESLPRGHFSYRIHLSVLSEEARAHFLQEEGTASVSATAAEPEVKKERKRRSDAGRTKADENLIFRASAIVTTAKASSTGRFSGDRDYGYKEGYDFFMKACSENKLPQVSYRQFINLAKPWVDKDVQKKVNLGTVRYKNSEQMTLKCDYSVYEPMQFLQNDHTQFDCICMHDKKILRPWASFHVSVGDRVLSYPTIVERPDSYSLADNLVNFVFKYGLSQRPVIYKSDNGRAQKSRLMTKTCEFEDVDLKPFDLIERHERALKMMSLSLSHEQGLIQNLGLIESHSQARVPRTKLIERQFGIGGTMEYFKDRKEYTGRKYEEKPERLAKIVKSGDIWTSEEMVEYVVNKIDDYNRRSHQGIKEEASGVFAVPHTYTGLDIEYFQTCLPFIQSLKGYIPEAISEVYRIFNDAEWSRSELRCEVYSPLWRRRCFEISGFIQRVLPSRDTLAMLALPSIEKTVHTYGITIGRKEYISLKLKPYISKKVIVRFSPENVVRIKEESGKEKLFIREVFVFEKSSEKFITIAEPHPRGVMGIKPQGYAKAFLSERTRDMQILSKATKITTAIAQGKEDEREDRTNIIRLSTFKDRAALDLKKARQEKLEQEDLRRLEEEEDDRERLRIYGPKIQEEN